MSPPSSDMTVPQDSQLPPVALPELKPCSDLPTSACLFEADPQTYLSLATPLGLAQSLSASHVSGDNIYREGTFIAYSLDTKLIAESYKGSISPKLYNDLLKEPVRRYLGLITSLGDIDDSEAEELVINFVGRKKPPVLDTLYMPIASSCADVDIVLRTKPLFPFEGLSVWTTCGTRVRTTQLQDSPSQSLDSLSSLRGRSPTSVVLEPAERQRLQLYIESDLAKLEAASVPDIARLKALRPPQPGSTIEVRVWCDIGRVDRLELDDPLLIIDDVRRVASYVNLLVT